MELERGGREVGMGGRREGGSWTWREKGGRRGRGWMEGRGWGLREQGARREKEVGL